MGLSPVSSIIEKEALKTRSSSPSEKTIFLLADLAASNTGRINSEDL